MSPCPRIATLSLFVAAALALVLPAQAQRRNPPRETPSAAPVRVESFTPQGPLASNAGAILTVRFNRDVVGADARTSRTAEGIIEVSPSLEGVAAWTSGRELRFVPRSPLRKGTRYVARVASARLEKVSGRKLEGDSEFRFSTPPLSFVKAEQDAFTPELSAIVSLHFSDKVEPADLYRYLNVTVAGQRLGWRVEGDAQNTRPRIITDPLTTDSLELTLQPGLTGTEGPLGLPAAITRRVPLRFALVPQSATAEWESGRPRLVIRMSNEAWNANVLPHVAVEPAVPFQVDSNYNQVTLTGDFVPATRYTVTLKKGLTYGGSVLLRDYRMPVWVPEMKPFLDLDMAGGHLSTKGGMKLRVNSSGVTTFTVSAQRVHDTNVVMTGLVGDSEYWIQRLGGNPRRADFTATPGTGRVTTDVDLRQVFGEQLSGLWYVAVQARPDEGLAENRWERFVRDTFISSSNIGVVAKRGEGSLTVWAAALDTALPLPETRVRVVSTSNLPLKEGATDAEGLVVFDGLARTGAEAPGFVLAEQGGEVSLLRLDADRVDVAIADELPRAFLSEGYEAFLSPERGAYRPGETVHLFGHVRGRGVAAPGAEFPLEIQLTRPDHRRSEPVTVKLGAAGDLQKDITIPAYAPTGLYRATLRLPGTGRGGDEAGEE